MGMSTHIIGFKAPDETWKKMKKIYDACEEAGVAVPDKVLQYFNYETPDEAGIEIDLNRKECVETWNANSEDGFVVDIKSLLKAHPDITHIRFYNSY